MHSQVLYAKDINTRQQSFEKAVNVGKDYQNLAASVILRSAVLRCGLHVKQSTSGGKFLQDLTICALCCTYTDGVCHTAPSSIISRIITVPAILTPSAHQMIMMW